MDPDPNSRGPARPSGTTSGLLRRALSSGVLRQSSSFAINTLLASVIGAVTTILLAKHLTIDGYAIFSLCNSLLGFGAMFFEFGLLVPATRRLPTASDVERREILGASTAIIGALGLSFSFTVVVSAFLLSGAFSVDPSDALLAVAPFAGGWVLSQSCMMLAQGANQISMYSISTVLAKVGYLLAIGLMIVADVDFGATLALVLESLAFLGAGFWVVVRLGPVFRNVRAQVGRLVSEARSYGFSAYSGRVLALGTYHIDVLMVAAFATSSDVAYYALAGSIALPVSLASTGIAIALFGPMTRADQLERRWITAVVGVAALSVVAASILAVPFVDVFLGSRYSGVIALVPPLALAQGFNGVTRLFNNFLWAHGRGNDLRNAAIILTVTNLVANIGLIPPYGALGAAWASALALGVNLGVQVWLYRSARAQLAQDAFDPTKEK